MSSSVFKHFMGGIFITKNPQCLDDLGGRISVKIDFVKFNFVKLNLPVKKLSRIVTCQKMN